VVYSTLSYDVGRMAAYFSAFATIWQACSQLVHRVRYGDATVVIIGSPETGTEMAGPTDSPRLRVHRLSIQSPMEITFAVDGGLTVVALYATLLFARVLRHPENIGAWLPRVITAWHREMREADKQREKRRVEPIRKDQLDPEMEELIEATTCLLELGTTTREVRAIGTDTPPDDLAKPDTFEAKPT
jgi:hypothetical protein